MNKLAKYIFLIVNLLITLPFLTVAQSWKIFNTSNSQLINDFVTHIYSKNQNNIWISSINGFSIFDGFNWANNSNFGIPNDNINEIKIDNNNNYWIGTSNGGVYKIDALFNVTEYTISNSGLSDNNVVSISFDNFNNVWFGTNNGISEFDGSTWKIYNTSNSGLLYDNIINLEFDLTGNLWISGSGALTRFDGSSWSYFNSTNTGFDMSYTNDIIVDNFNILWLVGYSGLIRFDGINWSNFDPSNSEFPDYIAYSIDIDNNNNKWIGSASGAVKYDDFTFKIYNTLNSPIPDNYVYSIAVNSFNTIYMGTYLGLVELKPTPCTNIDMSPSTIISLASTNNSGTAQIIIDCQHAGEFYGVNNVQLGSNYSFSSSDSIDYLTIHSGSYDGPIVNAGYTPVTITNASGEDLFIHTNTDSLCGTQNICRISSAQCTSCTLSGCTNYNKFPDTLISLYNSNGIQPITTCQNGGEYFGVTAVQPGNNYQFSSSIVTDFITVHEGSFDGPILIFGKTPVDILSTSGLDLYIHTNSDSICGSDGICRITAVQCTSCSFLGCTNINSFPDSIISLDSTNLLGTIQIITDCQYAGEYYHVTNLQSGNSYVFTSSNPGDYLTIHESTYNGKVLSYGITPVKVFIASGADLFVHTNTDSICGIDTICRISTAQCSTCPVSGCINFINYPTSIIQLDYTNSNGAIQIINDCNFAGEYYNITGILGGNNYSFLSSDSTDYITIRSGSFNGPIVLAGFTPLNLIGASGSDLYVHINTDSICGTEDSCRTTTVQCTTCHFDGCTNSIQNPDTLISLLTTNGAKYITNCQLGGQYYGVTGVQEGYNYQFASSVSNDYITVHEGTFNGNIIAAGITPVNINNASGADLFIHTNIDAFCGADSICRTSTAQCISCNFAGCTNSINYPKDSIISLDSTNSSGAIQLITDCNYAGEYYVVTNIKTGNNYQFASSNAADYITIHSGSYNGPIIKYGKTPVYIVGIAGSDLFVHINSDTLCGIDNSCRSSTVQCMSCCEAVSILNQPTDQTIYNASSATFNVAVNGTPPFTFQWYKNNSIIPGANNSTYKTPKLYLGDDGNKYYCLVTNCSGGKQAISDTAAVSVTSICDPIIITKQPTNQIANVGNTATFNVTVSGTSPASYLWYKLDKTLSLIPGANSSSYTTPILTDEDNGNIYFCYITNCNGSKSAITVFANLTILN